MMEIKLSRNKAQEKILVCVYQYLFYMSYDSRPSLTTIFDNNFSLEERKSDTFYKNVFINAIKNCPEIVKNITPYLQDWTFDRLGLLDQAILIMAYTERHYLNIDKAVVINVAVTLSKKYSAEDDTYKFINAVLDNVL